MQEVVWWVRFHIVRVGDCPICGGALLAVEVSEGDDAVGEYGSFIAAAFCRECTGPYTILKLTAIALSYKWRCSLSEALDFLLKKGVLTEQEERKLRRYIERQAREGEEVTIPLF